MSIPRKIHKKWDELKETFEEDPNFQVMSAKSRGSHSVQAAQRKITFNSQRQSRDILSQAGSRYGKSELSYMKENGAEMDSPKPINLLYARAKSTSKMGVQRSIDKMYDNQMMFKKQDVC